MMDTGSVSSSESLISGKTCTISHRSEYTPLIFVNILAYIFMCAHFRVDFYCGQPKAHLCNNHAV